jgi:two-component system, sensor histidine kinase and response regulator
MPPAKVILVVEDDPDLRVFYRQVLMISGYTVIAVEDGIDALRRIETDPPDLVILDIELPRLGGRDVQQELAAHTATRHIPIVVVSGTDTKTLDPAAFFCILRKPVTAEGLVAAVDECLRRAVSRWPRDDAARTQNHHGDRRTALYCPFCGDSAVACETTFKARVASQTWKCSVCDSAWPERRKAS